MRRDELCLVDCAGCGAELIGEKTRARVRAEYARLPADFPDPVRGRILGRPYCSACLDSRRPPNPPATKDDGPGPYYENALRALEG